MKPKWKKIWARDYSLLLGYYYGNAFGEKNPFLVCKNKLFLPENKMYASYVDENEFDKLIKIFKKYLLKVDIKNYAKKYELAFKQSVSWAKKLTSGNLAELDTRQLALRIKEFHKYFQPYTTLQYTAFVVLEGPGREVEYLMKFHPNSQKILGWIATPYKFTKMTKSRLELLKLAMNRKMGDKDLAAYLQKYQWTTLNDMTHTPLTLKTLKKEIKTIKNPTKEIQNIISHNEQNLQAYRNFLKKIPDKNQQKLINIVHHFSYLKEMRDDYRRHVYFILKPLFSEVAKRLEINNKQVCFLTAPEIISKLQKNQKVNRGVLNNRENKYSISILEGKVRIFDKDISKKFLHNTLSLDNSLKGQVAYPGRITGVARIINNPKDFNKFKKGQVLITTMTHPEFLPIMKMAKAIVTDEGGITCHAAIVSRELKIPCIIGTHHATQTLKDGDLVEVDANKGVVKKL